MLTDPCSVSGVSIEMIRSEREQRARCFASAVRGHVTPERELWSN